MTRRATITVVAVVAGWVTFGQTSEMIWQGTCGTTAWYATCHIGQCDGGANRIFNNWGQDACAPAQPAFPGTADAAVIPADVILSSSVAGVGWLTLSLADGSLEVKLPGANIVVQNQLTNWGQVITQDQGGIEVWGGTIDNFGTIVLRNGGFAGHGVLRVPADLTLGGSGSLVLDSGGLVQGGAVLTNAAGHTIRGGSGSISAPLVNEGRVTADIDGTGITLTGSAMTNHAVIEALDGSEVGISTTVIQSAAGELLANGADSFIRLLSGASVAGGTLASVNGGSMWTSGGGVSVSVADLTHTGYWGIENGAVVTISGATLTNDGTIEAGLYTGGAGWPQVVVSPGVVLAGSGDLRVSGSYVRGGPFSNAATHAIHGPSGRIEAELTNNGTITAESTSGVIYLTVAGKTNNGLIEAVGGADLEVLTTVTQGSGGMIAAHGVDSTILLRTGAHVVGGSLATSDDGRIWTSGGGTAPEVTDITNSGYWGIENGAVPVFTGTTLVNDGTIEAGLYMGGAGAPVLHVASPLALSGGGDLYFSGGRLETTAGVTWRNEIGHTIHGTSAGITASLVNRGSVVADWSGHDLRVYAQDPGIVNEGLIQVDAGCTLELHGADLFVQNAGVTSVQGSLELSGGPLALAGGTLAGSGTVHGSVDSSGGSVNPGSSVGRLVVDGDYTQGADGRLTLELGGTSPGEYDVLDVNGSASLDGTLYVTAIGGFEPQPGDTFTILEANLSAGEFDRVESWTDTNCGPGFTVTYDASSVVITAVESSASIFCSNFEIGNTSPWSSATP